MEFKFILNTFFNRRFIAGFLASLILILPIYLLHINPNVIILTCNVNFISIIQILIFSASLYFIRQKKFEDVILGMLSGVVFIIVGFFIRSIIQTFSTIVEWDFLCFYLNGKATVEGLSLYDPISFANVLSNIQLPFTLSDSFYTGAIQTGVIYPPTTMLLLAPLGYLDINTANIVWRIFVITFMVIDIILLYRIFKVHQSQWLQLLLILTLTLIFPGSRSTIDVSQTNFLILFLILLIYRDPDNWKAGVYLALAVIVKPIPVIWALYFLINKKWKPFLSFCITGVLIVLMSVIQLGFNNFMTYFTSPPVLRIPAGSFSEDVNQSLNAVFFRVSQQFGMDSVLQHMNIVVLVVSLILVVLTCTASLKLAKTNVKASFLVFLPLSLLIFPGTLTHYAVQLIPLFMSIILLKEKTSLLFFSFFLLIMYLSLFMASLVILTVIVSYAFLNIPVFTWIKRNEENTMNLC